VNLTLRPHEYAALRGAAHRWRWAAELLDALRPCDPLAARCWAGYADPEDLDSGGWTPSEWYGDDGSACELWAWRLALDEDEGGTTCPGVPDAVADAIRYWLALVYGPLPDAAAFRPGGPITQRRRGRKGR